MKSIGRDHDQTREAHQDRVKRSNSMRIEDHLTYRVQFLQEVR